jgi:hypothetical protein
MDLIGAKVHKKIMWNMKEGLQELRQSKHVPHKTTEQRLTRWMESEGLSQFHPLTAIKKRLKLVGFEPKGDVRKRPLKEYLEKAQSIAVDQEELEKTLAIPGPSHKPRNIQQMVDYLKSEKIIQSGIQRSEFRSWLKKNLLKKRAPMEVVIDKIRETGFGAIGKEIVPYGGDAAKSSNTKHPKSSGTKRNAKIAGLDSHLTPVKKTKRGIVAGKGLSKGVERGGKRKREEVASDGKKRKRSKK